MPLTFNISIAVDGEATDQDKRAAIDRVNRKNQEIANANQLRQQNGDPLEDLLPTSPLAALATSYEACLEEDILRDHDRRVTQIAKRKLDARRDAWKNADDATQAQIDALLGV